MNVLGVVFDSKLNWSTHVAQTIVKAKRALIALRLIKRFFSISEMRTLLDANFYSILYYNAVIWLTPHLSSDLKQNLLSISANALRTCLKHDGFELSFENIHKVHKKSTPKQIMLYQQAILLHKIINHKNFPSCFEHITVIEQVVCTRRQLRLKFFKNNKLKIGLNMTANKFFNISDQVGMDLLNLSFVHYKKIMKIQFLKYGKT